MPSYAGRNDQLPETLNIGGINRNSTILNIKDSEAQDITNWDILRGNIQVRSGYTAQSTIAAPGATQYSDNYTRQDGTTVYVNVVNGVFYESTSPSGPWTDQSAFNGLNIQDKTGADGTPALGVAFGNSYVMSNAGLSAPVYSQLYNALVTLENASRLDPPTGLTGLAVGGTGTTATYVVTAITGRGETIASAPVAVSGGAVLSGTIYNRITWSPVLGANAGYRIYKYDVPSNTYIALTVGALSYTLATTFDDTGVANYSPTINPPLTNGAYNTPNDWNVNGQPEGFAAIAIGRDQRLLAWRKDTVWVCAAGNCLDWLTTGASGAFTFTVYGATDNRITGCAPLYDLTMITTRTNSLFYTGSSATDFVLSRIQGTGCFSPKSFIQVENDLMMWSQYGPTSVQRILAGADVQATNISEKIRPLINDDTEKSFWWRISAFNDVKNRKAVWLYPDTGQSASEKVNQKALVYNYTIGGWTKYDNFLFCDASLNPIGDVYLLQHTTGKLMKIGGFTDDGTPITATYVTGWFDLRSWMKKRMVWVDFIVDKLVASTYAIGLSTSWNWGQTGTTTTHTLTESTTDGSPLLVTSNIANYHRIYTLGDNQSFQFTLTTTSSVNSPSILGWRPDARTKGVR
jgi:hypothetical protein